LNLRIHKGAKEIGGSCVEIWTESTRILVDFGMPLVERDGSEFDYNKYKDLSIDELKKRNIIPDIHGAYKNSKPSLDGILISHPHQDHFGLVNFLHEELMYYIGEAAFRIINTSNLFTNKELLFKKHSFIQKEKTFRIRDISITPYWMDHSAFDSYAFLIEADGKKILYSGDFRGHGRKSKLFHWFINNAPCDVDYLLLEGTTIGRGKSRAKSEQVIQHELEQVFIQDKISLVYTSGQNIDRLVTIYKACKNSNKIFVIDPYIASILKESARFGKIQHPSESFKDIKVMFPYFLTGRMLKTPCKNLIYQFARYKITRDQVQHNPGRYVMCIRPSIKLDLSKTPGIDGGNLVYSMWEGYLSKEPTRKFIDYLVNRRFTLYKVHTSGHADIWTLKKLVNALNPGFIIPIHTFAAAEYSKKFSRPVKLLADGEILAV
jgi:ribonuclease J